MSTEMLSKLYLELANVVPKSAVSQRESELLSEIRHLNDQVTSLKFRLNAIQPMAKPLVWEEEPTPFDGVHRYSYGCFCGKTLYQCGYTDGTHYGHFRVGNEIFYAPTREEVKEACEAHHQAQFLELLA